MFCCFQYAQTLEKGDYVVRLFIRHEKIESLEKLKDISLYIRNAISGVSQDLYTSHLGLVKGTGKKSGSKAVQKNATATYFLHPIADDKLPKGVTNGNFLIGELGVFKESGVNKVDNHRIYYHINNTGGSSKKDKQSSASAKKAEPKKKTDEAEKLKEAVRDAQVPFITK